MRLSLATTASLILLAGAVPGAMAQGRLDVFVTPIPDVPFSGTIAVERASILQNGSVINLKSLRNIGRDSQGRIYNESRTLVPVASTLTPELIAIHLYDPQTRISTMLNPQKRTFWTAIVSRPPAAQPPALLYASSTASTIPQNQFTKEEDLGTRQIDGLPAHGVRENQLIPASMSGTGKDIVTSDEYWYSDDLRINLMIKHNDQRTGSVTMTVTEIVLSEPNPDLWKIPNDYTPAGTLRTAAQ